MPTGIFLLCADRATGAAAAAAARNPLRDRECEVMPKKVTCCRSWRFPAPDNALAVRRQTNRRNERSILWVARCIFLINFVALEL